MISSHLFSPRNNSPIFRPAIRLFTESSRASRNAEARSASCKTVSNEQNIVCVIKRTTRLRHRHTNYIINLPDFIHLLAVLSLLSFPVRLFLRIPTFFSCSSESSQHRIHLAIPCRMSPANTSATRSSRALYESSPTLHRPDEPARLAMMVSKHGLPLGYRLYNGASWSATATNGRKRMRMFAIKRWPHCK